MNTQTIINSRDRSSTTPHVPTRVDCPVRRSSLVEKDKKNENEKYEQSY